MIKLKSFTLHTRILQSAMAGCTDLAFRLIARQFGLQFAFLEMISANALVYKGPRTFQILRKTKEDSPIGVQIVGSNPATMGEAAAILENMGFDLLDINCGCPVPKIVSKGSGAALLCTPEKAREIFVSVIRHIKRIPVTVKLRSGFADPSGKEALQLALIAQDVGVSAVTVHGRTRAQGYSDKADWTVVRKVKEVLNIPVFGNGDIRTGEDAKRLMQLSNCDAVMVGRASLGNPWLYRSIQASLEGTDLPLAPSLEERKRTSLKHLDYVIELYGKRRGVKKFRTIACWYLKDMPGSSQWRECVNGIDTEKDMREAIIKFTPFDML